MAAFVVDTITKRQNREENKALNDPLQKKQKLLEKIAGKELGKTGDSRTGKISSENKKTATLQSANAKTAMMQSRRQRC